MTEQELQARLGEIQALLYAAQSALNDAINAMSKLRQEIEAAKAEKALGEMRRWSDGSNLLTVEHVAL